MNEDLEKLALAVLQRIGFLEHANKIAQEIYDTVNGEYGDDWEGSGTTYSSIMLRDDAQFASPFNKFSQEQRSFLDICSRDNTLHVECKNLRLFLCSFDVDIPINPADTSGERLSIDIRFKINDGYNSKIQLDEVTCADASEKKIKLALLAYLMTQK